MDLAPPRAGKKNFNVFRCFTFFSFLIKVDLFRFLKYVVHCTQKYDKGVHEDYSMHCYDQ